MKGAVLIPSKPRIITASQYTNKNKIKIQQNLNPKAFGKKWAVMLKILWKGEE